MLLQQRSREGIARTISFGVENDKDIPDDFVENAWKEGNTAMIDLIDRRLGNPKQAEKCMSGENRSGLELWRLFTALVR